MPVKLNHGQADVLGREYTRVEESLPDGTASDSARRAADAALIKRQAARIAQLQRELDALVHQQTAERVRRGLR